MGTTRGLRGTRQSGGIRTVGGALALGLGLLLVPASLLASSCRPSPAGAGATPAVQAEPPLEWSLQSPDSLNLGSLCCVMGSSRSSKASPEDRGTSPRGYDPR
jgi:hypothetical protein